MPPPLRRVPPPSSSVPLVSRRAFCRALTPAPAGPIAQSPGPPTRVGHAHDEGRLLRLLEVRESDDPEDLANVERQLA
eukprot:1335534-Pleurochrysis_carterae.AAC.1